MSDICKYCCIALTTSLSTVKSNSDLWRWRHEGGGVKNEKWERKFLVSFTRKQRRITKMIIYIYIYICVCVCVCSSRYRLIYNSSNLSMSTSCVIRKYIHIYINVENIHTYTRRFIYTCIYINWRWCHCNGYLRRKSNGRFSINYG